MTAVGFIGAMFSLVALRWAFVVRENSRLALFVMMLIYHIAASAAYYIYVQSNDADTYLYYADPYNMFGQTSGLGTWFTIDLVQTMKRWFGGSYFDYFLIFQTIGFWGVVLLGRTVEEICRELDIHQPSILYVVLLLPGLYFWTSAIGKDAPLFLGCALTMWATLRLKSRYLWFGLGVLIMFPFRPHISLIALTAAVGTIGFDSRTKPAMRILLGICIVIGIAIVGSTVGQSFNIDMTSSASVTQFFDNNNNFNGDEGSSLANSPYIVKLFSLLFRPFFIDANGIFGLIASFENIIIFGIFIDLTRNWRLVTDMAKRIAFVRFALIFFVILAGLLAALYYNVGLGLRQKAMLMPALLSLYAAVVAVRIAARGQRDDPGMVSEDRVDLGLPAHSFEVVPRHP